MATWTADTIQDASLDVSSTQKTQVVTGVVEGIDTSVDPRELLWYVVDFLIGQGFTFDPPMQLTASRPDMLLRRMRVQGVGPSTTRVWIAFETFQGGPLTAFIIEHDSVLTTRETDLIPGTRRPIRIESGFAASEDENGNPVSIPMRGDNVLMRLFFPLESIRIYGLSYGEPLNIRIRRVNDADWPVGQPGFTTYPPGYWITAKSRTVQAKYTNYHQFEAEMITRVDEDWSEFGILIDRRTGQHFKIDDTTLAAATGPDYSYGIIFEGNGMIRAGPYQLAGYTAMIGF